MTIRAPCVEWEQSSKYAESNECEREEDVLYPMVDFHARNAVVLCNLNDIHCGSPTEEVDAKDAQYQQCGTTHQHEGEFHCRVFLCTATPYANEQVHWDKSHLIEHEHCEHVGADEESIDTCAEEGEPKEILLGERLELP